MPKLRHVIPVVGIAVEVVAAATLVATLPEPDPAEVNGTVRCTSGAAVQGVWIEGFSGGSGYASLTPAHRHSPTVSYRYVLPSGGDYQVHVGCGGTPSDWDRTLRSSYVEPGTRHFLCADAEADV